VALGDVSLNVSKPVYVSPAFAGWVIRLTFKENNNEKFDDVGKKCPGYACRALPWWRRPRFMALVSIPLNVSKLVYVSPAFAGWVIRLTFKENNNEKFDDVGKKCIRYPC
jgi:hypothetical protein